MASASSTTMATARGAQAQGRLKKLAWASIEFDDFHLKPCNRPEHRSTGGDGAELSLALTSFQSLELFRDRRRQVAWALKLRWRRVGFIFVPRHESVAAFG